MRYRPSLAEQEVIIRFDAEERTAHIYSSNPVYIRRLDKLCEEHPETYKCTEVDKLGYYKRYECPADRIKLSKPYQMSEVQKAALKRARQNSPIGD